MDSARFGEFCDEFTGEANRLRIKAGVSIDVAHAEIRRRVGIFPLDRDRTAVPVPPGNGDLLSRPHQRCTWRFRLMRGGQRLAATEALRTPIDQIVSTPGAMLVAGIHGSLIGV
jgi:hypothetical protein